jgi:hypothetical protein
MRLLALPLVAALASGGWALTEMRPPHRRAIVAAIAPVLAAEPQPADAPRPPPPPVLAAPSSSLPRVALVSGKVLEADGHPAEWTDVELEGDDLTVRVSTDNTGAFTALVPPGEYTITFTERTIEEAPELSLQPGEEVRGLELKVEPEENNDEGEKKESEEAPERPRRVIRIESLDD